MGRHQALHNDMITIAGNASVGLAFVTARWYSTIGPGYKDPETARDAAKVLHDELEKLEAPLKRAVEHVAFMKGDLDRYIQDQQGRHTKRVRVMENPSGAMSSWQDSRRSDAGNLSAAAAGMTHGDGAEDDPWKGSLGCFSN